MVGKAMWDKRTWLYPRIHDFEWGFGLSLEDETKNTTIVPIVMQDNAIVDYETINTNPENEDFSVVAYPNTAQGSYVGKAMTSWWGIPFGLEVDIAKFMTMDIHTSMLNRLDAFNKSTGEDVETIIELTHETTDEQAYPAWANVKLFESHKVIDYPVNVPGLTTTQQPESVAFNNETYYDAIHHYTNKEMIKQVTDRQKWFTVQSRVHLWVLLLLSA